MVADLVPRQAVYSALRTHLPFFAVACIILLSGVCSLVLAHLRSRDRLLLSVGVFSILYAARLFLQNDLVRDAFNSPGAEYLPWALSITYLINIPFSLFARELLGKGWRNTISVWLWLNISFAVVAVPCAFLAFHLRWLGVINGFLVVAGTLLILPQLLLARRNGNPLAASLFWPLLIFGVLIVFENAGFRLGGQSVEPLGFLILLAALVYIAVRRALATERRLLDVQQELSTARRIQSAIIPQSTPVMKGIRLATRYLPMTAVAGDFFDFLHPSDDLLTILVADVSGHGVPAALVACMLKICFAAQAAHSANPAAILSGLNVMLRDSLGGQYLTAACATVNTRANTITYSGAGHPPSLLARVATGELLPLAENGLFIGPFPNATYSNISVPFHSGDRLLLYTDGITEASDSTGQEFGREKLGQLLLDTSTSDPDAVLDHLFEQIQGANQQDDLTAVLVHLEPGA